MCYIYLYVMMCNHGLYMALTVHDLYDASIWIQYLHVRLYAHMCYVGDKMTCNVLPPAQNLGFRTIPFGGGGVSTRDSRPYVYMSIPFPLFHETHPPLFFIKWTNSQNQNRPVQSKNVSKHRKYANPTKKEKACYEIEKENVRGHRTNGSRGRASRTLE